MSLYLILGFVIFLSGKSRSPRHLSETKEQLLNGRDSTLLIRKYMARRFRAEWASCPGNSRRYIVAGNQELPKLNE